MAEQLAQLADDRALLGRTSTAERVSDILRSRIADGFFPPGTRLSEDSIGGALGISRNTLREAFRLLTHERLLVHELNRGVFVRVLTVDDVEDIYRTRALVECAVVRGLGEPPYDLAGVARAVDEARRAAREGDWKRVGTANIHFHRELVALAGSERTDEVMRSVFAELRLAFHVVDDPHRLHEPYIARNQEVLDLLAAGDREGAERLLAGYLADSLERVLEVYRRRVGEDG
ncbi:GntR family transcriptional regulator [Streptomyces griseoviridis]|jgi:DNA-binding GntR family transcriptional regulator|uniref:DNA-binding GntR family transcriptional regulator n=3 Tax=Streptomyces TaxID=1883 RepID=A0ABT9LA81_STRGD|nr:MULTISPECIES: GntR family transcriptional regulator [Streptomyces]MDP9680613.1 DNA-binding GntR family transcriptional regulator [Streptomyces griseoviridis]GGS36199.1 GntR family transcriptional regulator [Streptomyces niveoruber]GGS99079.1 GntR family transcriptional regulator [Streptomyces griseoviridis]GGU41551.1 GntR family transcriptional regulator [Streptomyces daghestanicus]GHI28859.1 GntR family transcriptional regulator [Streptomyces daghestanicus]